ncbi:DUF5722 domain-containing protein [Rubellicoccus peritrichatus]|uniref:DUF5722 domain-containing protein n=1 Tax=Rubellicoccus peritrichatus TaxID=3080537 RepID=A0AAQ3QT45_9BACT|nr:DUF5722 domain-containing protein [Puniceicoccus sp. CR14]WOO43298.1 DUF5722 domain-containing protein [Puniceicoccus sp. CR14]
MHLTRITTLLILMAAPLIAANKMTLVPAGNFGVKVTKLETGVYELETTDEDPQVVFEAKTINKTNTVLSFDYFCPDGVGWVEVFYKSNKSQQWSSTRKIEAGRMPKAETWQPFSADLHTLSKGKWTNKDRLLRIDFGRDAGTKIQLRNVRLRPPTVEEAAGAEALARKRQEKLEIAQLVDDYLAAEYPWGDIESVLVGPDTVAITGKIAENVEPPRHLIEYAPHENPWEPNSGTILEDEMLDHEFSIVLPRFVEGRDRIAQRWALAAPRGETQNRFTPAVWATDVNAAAERNMPRLRPINKKGIGGMENKKGIFSQDVTDLGISAGTINLDISGLFNLPKGEPTISFEHQGRTWDFNKATVQNWDNTIRLMSDHDIVVSAILLIGPKQTPLLHPDYIDAGIYSIANFTIEEGTDAYRAAVAFLAERYSRPDKKYGWVTHWIVFNEVDFGWVWTNMGEQPEAIYFDTYQKALRLTWLETRRFNPTSEVFISLTHHWDYGPADSFRSYPPRSLLDRLATYSSQEGDYQWGVAYHPYPQRLFYPRTWEDRSPTASFDTPYITPQNIEVLDSYLNQPEFLYDGSPRTVLLSEQGFHTPDYDDASMQDKAAAIAYTWAKIMPLESVESFHYHRWVDHPKEGGLKLGLRTLPSPGKPYGERKEPAFSVFAALETDEQEETLESILDYIGISDWSDVLISTDSITKENTNNVLSN